MNVKERNRTATADIRMNVRDVRMALRGLESAAREGRWEDVARLANVAAAIAGDCVSVADEAIWRAAR